MIPTLITADLQLAEGERDSYRFTIFPTLGRLIIKTGARRLLILGDLTEAKDRHSATLVNRIADELVKLSIITYVVILRGNHEGQTADNPFFHFVRHINQIRWINNPIPLKHELFLPHTLNYKKNWDLDFSGFRFIFAHNTFEGAKGANGSLLKGIPVSVFPKDVKVISGDVHSPQRIGPVQYVGAPYRVDFGDDYNPRVLFIDGNERITSIPIEGPQKKLITVTWPKGPAYTSEPFNPGDILKVRVHLEHKYISQWAEIRDKIRKWGEDKKYSIHSIQPVVDVVPGQRGKSSEAVTKSDEELMQQYAKRKDVDERTLNKGLDLVESCDDDGQP